MQKSFYILDDSTEVEGINNVIYLWAIDNEGSRVALFDKNFLPYFYVLLSSEGYYEEVESKIRRVINQEGKLIKMERLKMKYYGQEVPAIKVYIASNLFWKSIKDELSKVQGVRDVLEADIRPSLRYMIDNDIVPFTWYKLEVEEVKNSLHLKVDKVYEIKRILGREENNFTEPKFRMLAFTILVYNRYGFPDPRRDKIIAITAYTDQGSKVFVTSNNDTDDAGIIKQFMSFIKEYDPDIIFGFNSNYFDLPYILERAENKGIKNDISRKPDTGANQGIYGHFGIAGRINIDLSGFVESFVEVKIKTLENIVEYLGLFP
ncbi:MAG: DNA polymerase II, partial [Sulfolobus sp.]|nr:DNA polymerase II [Sulfolobus sp.]